MEQGQHDAGPQGNAGGMSARTYATVPEVKNAQLGIQPAGNQAKVKVLKRPGLAAGGG